MPDQSMGLVGKVLGHFKILETIGHGGMGVVFKAHDTTLDRVVALKVLSLQLHDQEYIERFIREAKISANLEHPHIVPIYSIASHDTQGSQGSKLWYIAMQYIEGKTLADYIYTKKRISPRKALIITRHVADALRVAHRQNVIHRDIKPNNIMIDINSKVKVMDFGLARSFTGNTKMTQTNTYMGTPEYSSPEQCTSGELAPTSDIYSLGVVLYEMLSGRVPHKADTPLALFRKIVDEDPTPLSQVVSDIPPEVLSIVTKMLARDTKERYQSCDAVIHDIDAVIKLGILKSSSGEEEKETPVPISTPVRPRRRPRRPQHQTKTSSGRGKKWFVGIAVACLLVIGVSFGLGIDQKGVTPEVNADIQHTATSTVPTADVVKAVDVMKTMVLDFRNISGNKEYAWLEVGLPDMLIGDLVDRSDLHVVSRHELIQQMKEIDGKKFVPGKEEHLALDAHTETLINKIKGNILIQGKFYVSDKQTIRLIADIYRYHDNALKLLTTCQVEGDQFEKQLLGLIDQLSDKIVAVLALDGDKKIVATKGRRGRGYETKPSRVSDMMVAKLFAKPDNRIREKRSLQNNNKNTDKNQEAEESGKQLQKEDVPAPSKTPEQIELKEGDLGKPKGRVAPEKTDRVLKRDSDKAKKKDTEYFGSNATLMEKIRQHYRQIQQEEEK